MQYSKVLQVYLLLMTAVTASGFSMQDQGWQKISSGIYESEITSLAVAPDDPNIVFAGTHKTLYRSNNKGKEFFAVSGLSGGSKEIHSIYIPATNSDEIYVATDEGAFYSPDGGRRWELIYFSADAVAKQCWDITRMREQVYVATNRGIFQKGVNESVWQKQEGELGNTAVYELAVDDQNLYAASASAVYMIGSVNGLVEKMFSLGSKVSEEVSEDEFYGIQALELEQKIRDIYMNQGNVYVLSDFGVFVRQGQGSAWKRMVVDGLPVEFGTRLVMVNSNIVVATSKGVFFLDGDQWKALYQGMETTDVESLAADGKGNLYAGTDKGLFFSDDFIESKDQEKYCAQPRQALQTNSLNQSSFHEFQASYQQVLGFEPSVQEVHKMAIDYAEVHPGKIKEWRELSRKKAWLPDLSVSMDGDQNRTVSDSIYGSYTSGGQHYLAPDDKTFYSNFGWGVSLSWDLADIVWSTDQTSIDSRSKLMVELREDILDQVTRLYFERRRVQVDLLAAVSLMPDPRWAMDKQLRVDELTAMIDALTDGEFTKCILEMKQ